MSERLCHKKVLPLAIATVLTGMSASSAWAALDVAVCQVNNLNACAGGVNDISPEGVLTLRGYAIDREKGDVPIPGGHLIVRNENTLVAYKIPINRVEIRPDVIRDKIRGELKPDEYDLLNSGFIAQVFMASLPPGSYSVVEAHISMKKAGVVKAPLDASNRAMFQIGAAGGYSLNLVTKDGATFPLTLINKGETNVVTGYPPLRDGDYKIEASFQTAGQTASSSVDFHYKRPVHEVFTSFPLVEEFPGQVAKLQLQDPLTRRNISVNELPVVVDELNSETVKVDGTTLVKDKKIKLAKADILNDLYQPKLMDIGENEGEQTVRLFVELPDAPNIHLKLKRWDPEKIVTASASKPTASIRVEDIDINAKLINYSEETCNNFIVVRPEYKLAKTNGIQCAMKWEGIPEGFKYNPYRANALKGSLPSLGDNVFNYRAGVIFTDPATKQTSFYPTKTPAKTLIVQGKNPKEITITLHPDRNIQPFYDSSGQQFPDKFFAQVDPVQPRLVGSLNVNAGHRRIMTKVTYPDSTERTFFSSVAKSNHALTLMAPKPWDEYPVKVESWYELAPEIRSEKIFNFVGVPARPVIEFDRDIASHDQADTIIHGRIGIVKGQDFTFDPAVMGQWQINAVDVKSGKSMSAPVSVLEDGSFAINLGRLTKGSRLIYASAKMVAGETIVNHKIESRPRVIITERGDELDGFISSHSVYGHVPFMQTIYFNLKDSGLYRSVGEIKWERQEQDGKWVRIMKDAENEYTGMNYTPTLNKSGKVAFRAVAKNKFSGMEFVSEPYILHAYNKPSFNIVAPEAVVVNKPVDLSIEEDNGYEAEYTWKFISKGAVEDVSTAKGKTFRFTPKALQSYVIEVSGREIGAPETNQSKTKKVVAIKSVNPMVAHASISGPKIVEVGKTYQFVANINDVVPKTTRKQYEIKGYWSLPDGRRVDGLTLDYTVQKGDKALAFITYIDGYPEETSVATYPFSQWEYIWPTNWTIQLNPLYTDVPAQVRYQVQPVNFNLNSLRGEKLKYTWSLPSGVVRTGEDSQGIFSIDKHGTYQVAVQISDARGNTVNVTSDQFSILPAAHVQNEMNITSKYGDSFYAPGTYYIGTKVTQVPRGDSFIKNELFVNNKKVGEFTGSGTYVSFAQPGKYDVMVRTITKLGNYGDHSLSLDVAAPPSPTCSVASKMSSSGMLYTPTCKVDVGYVKSYIWTYDLDGAPQKSTSKNFVALKSWVEQGRISNLSLTVESDLGAKTQESLLIK